MGPALYIVITVALLIHVARIVRRTHPVVSLVILGGFGTIMIGIVALVWWEHWAASGFPIFHMDPPSPYVAELLEKHR